MNPDTIYALGSGEHPVNVRLFRLWEPEPRLMYEGPATLHLTTMDRVAQRKRVKGYPDHDFWFGISTPTDDVGGWAEMSRQDYNGSQNNADMIEYQGECYVVEDYETVFI